MAIALLTMATTSGLGLGLREAWRRAENARFQAHFARAAEQLERSLAEAARELPGLLGPLCEHDPMLALTLEDLERARLDRDRRLRLSLLVPELMAAYRLDELILVAGNGEVIASGGPARPSGRQPELAALLQRPTPGTELLHSATGLSLRAHCVKRSASGGQSLGLVGQRSVPRLFEEAGRAQDLTLALEPPAPDDTVLSAALPLRALGDVTVYASQSRQPLLQALSTLDRTALLLGGGSLAVATLAAWFIARGLARPIVLLSEQAQAVMAGEPRPVAAGGGRELRQLAATFNQALADLASLRRRLAATERIAARREIARQVAHEIKNPLAPIQAAVETLRRLRARNDPAFDDYFEEATRTVLIEVARISQIVSAFTRFSRLPAPQLAPTDVVEAAQQVTQLHAAGGAPVSLKVQPVPLISADRDQLVQVLTNLVQNGLDAGVGRDDAWVLVEVGPVGSDRVRIAVSDNGPGVPGEIVERLFEPYATTKPAGTGLGLAIAQRLAVEHGGELGYRPRPGGGALFELTLPVAGPGLLQEPPTVTAL